MTSTERASNDRTTVDLLALWREVADGFTERLSAVGPQHWSAPTCCPAWDVAALVDHVIEVQRVIPRALGATGAVDATGEDVPAVWSAVRSGADAALGVPGALEEVIDVEGGNMPARNALRLLLGDLLIHTWDLARAIGVDDRLLPEACAMVLANLEPMDGVVRGPGMYAPKLEPVAGADVQGRLLAFSGRKD